jgi:osmotically-inducible protein OsmY
MEVIEMKIKRNATAFGVAFLVLVASGVAAPLQEAKADATGSVGLAMAAKQRPLSRPSDQELAQQVELALKSNRYVYAEHVSVTSKDGVVTLHGMVGSEWDLISALDISGRVPGVRRVVDGLEIWEFGGPR